MIKIYPVLYLTGSGNASHVAFVENKGNTLCGREIDSSRTLYAYKNNTMFINDMCFHCKKALIKLNEAGSI